MEAGVILLLLFAVLGGSSTQSFYGDSISFMPLQKKADGRFKVTYYHRQNGRSDCYNQSSFTCEGGACTDLVQSDVVQTDQDDSGQGRWCQSEGRTTVWVQPNGTTFTLRDSSCCWVSNAEGTTSWMSGAELDLGTRSDSHNLNNCPVTTTVSSLRIPQNCFTRVHLLAHDPDGDAVTCRFAPGATVPSGFTLDQTTCTLRNTGDVQTGVHVMELVLEDFPTSNISLSYTDGTSATRGASDMDSPPLCEVQLQFSVEVLPPISTCVVGNLLPMFLSRTLSHGEVLYATLGQTFQLYAQAQAQNSQIQTFQVSGPENMTQEFSTGSSGKAEVTLSWTPQQEDLRRLVPVCFTAETAETQSEMRCVVVMVTRATISQGIVTVSCSSNKMTVTLDKASMPDIDEHYLNLRDPSCSLVSNDTYITGTMSFSTCGTTLEDKGDYIVFSNEIHSFERPTEVITRRKKVQIDFSCEFPKTISISSYYNVYPSDYIFTESSFGSFGYSFGIFLDGNFTNSVPANAYPVQVNLLDMIYMGIQADADLPNVTLFVESCKATPDDNPENSLSYYLIQNGCLEDETVKVHPSNQTSFFFEVEAFKFNGDFNQVYITCVVILCETGNPFSRCSQGCLSNPSRRRRRGLSKETTRHYITQGPLQFVESSPSSPLEEERLAIEPRIDSEGQNMNEPTGSEPGISPAVIPGTRSGEYSWGIKKALTSNITMMVLSAGFIILLILLAVIIHRLGQRRKAEDCDVLIDPDFESEPN